IPTCGTTRSWPSTSASGCVEGGKMALHPNEATIPEPWPTRLRPGAAALVIVDMQNDFVSPEGKMAALGFALADVATIVAPLGRLLAAARDAGLLVVHTRMLNDRAQNSPSWYAFWGEPVVAKYGYGAFLGTNLDTILRRAGVQTVIVAGTGPEICAGDTLRQAFAFGYHVVAVADCLASFSRAGRAMNQDLKRAALYTIENHYGLVTTADALARLWQEPSR
ncbi:MAG: cysteine hydrolase, partial [Candidatus Acetothermia bacterium]|nr:cysteine hydrolase [Candidatus Acetothermia bacterium]